MKKIKQNLLILTIIGSFISCKKNDNIILEQSIEVNEQTNSYEQSSNNEEKIYELFKINSSLNGNSIDISISTDLPDNTKISLSVNRSYWEKGDSETEYNKDYFSEEGTVGQWKNTRTIVLKKQIWQNSITEYQNEMAKLGLGFDVAKISDSISVYAVVLSKNIPEPIFKETKMALTEVKLFYPFNGKIEIESKYENSQSLKIGKTYSLSKTTPLMPELNPSDPIKALEKVKQLESENRVKILTIDKKSNMPWYKVKAFTKKNKSVGIGWINSTSLIGQELRVIE